MAERSRVGDAHSPCRAPHRGAGGRGGGTLFLPPIRASWKLKMIRRAAVFHVESPDATVAV